MDEGLLSIISAGFGQLVKMPITLEPHGIFGSNFANLFILAFYFFINPKKPSKVILTSYKQVSISRDITQSCKKCTNYINDA